MSHVTTQDDLINPCLHRESRYYSLISVLDTGFTMQKLGWSNLSTIGEVGLLTYRH